MSASLTQAALACQPCFFVRGNDDGRWGAVPTRWFCLLQTVVLTWRRSNGGRMKFPFPNCRLRFLCVLRISLGSQALHALLLYTGCPSPRADGSIRRICLVSKPSAWNRRRLIFGKTSTEFWTESYFLVIFWLPLKSLDWTLWSADETLSAKLCSIPALKKPCVNAVLTLTDRGRGHSAATRHVCV